MIHSPLVSTAMWVGFFGDMALQWAVGPGKMGGPTGWGLKEYFAQHGQGESLFIAAGMMGIFYAAYLATGWPVNLTTMAIYGFVLDVVFRKWMLFPSLKGYYSALSFFWSTFWGALPMVMPLVLLGRTQFM